MALACAWSIGLRGVDGEVVEIEADLGQGLPGVSLVGLPDAALAESRDRVRAAVVNSGETWPARRITLALSPATLPKQGSGYDLALACCVLAAAGSLPVAALRGVVLVGELALDGRVRSTRGILPALIAAKRAGARRAVVPAAAAVEAGLVDGLEVLGASHLADVLAWLRGETSLRPVDGTGSARVVRPAEDLADVVGQQVARRAVEVAAAGGHHLLLMGPPGAGKTMLARRMVGLLPGLAADDALQVAAIRSLAGTTDPDEVLPSAPPFVAPHHTVSPAALVGGGSGLARPGAVSLAHRGLLFLDEVLEFGPHVLEMLRTPLEDGEVRLARKDGVVRYPARFQLVMAANPCPCAPARDTDCTCVPRDRARYRSRLSGPLLDRIDLRVGLSPLQGLSWSTDDDGSAAPEPAEPTGSVRERVLAARAAAADRWRVEGWRTNAEVPGPALRRRGRLPVDAVSLLDHELRTGALTARGVDRCLRVAWTVSDLRGLPRPDTAAVREALGFKRAEAAGSDVGDGADHATAAS